MSGTAIFVVTAECDECSRAYRRAFWSDEEALRWVADNPTYSDEVWKCLPDGSESLVAKCDADGNLQAVPQCAS